MALHNPKITLYKLRIQGLASNSRIVHGIVHLQSIDMDNPRYVRTNSWITALAKSKDSTDNLAIASFSSIVNGPKIHDFTKNWVKSRHWVNHHQRTMMLCALQTSHDPYLPTINDELSVSFTSAWKVNSEREIPRIAQLNLWSMICAGQSYIRLHKSMVSTLLS